MPRARWAHLDEDSVDEHHAIGVVEDAGGDHRKHVLD